jgi:Type II CAAX prenyl endopeptidase Rce1-like
VSARVRTLRAYAAGSRARGRGGARSKGGGGAPSPSSSPSPGFFALGRGDLPLSLVVVFPLLLAYQLAIVFVPSVVATDPISRLLFALCQGRAGYLLVQAAIAVAFLWWVHATGRSRTLSLRVIAPVMIEALAIALVLWIALPLLVHRALGLGLGTSAASALGAGVYEELMFRLLVTGAALQLALALGLHRREAAVLAVVIGALSFAAAHHLGAAGEPFGAAAFAFRVLAGLALGATCWFRSFAHAVYAHVAYDLIVLLDR